MFSATPSILSVGQCAELLQQTLRLSPQLGDLWLRGEASDVHWSARGHCYFGLSDPETGAQLRCVLFRFNAARQKHPPTAGASLVVHGKLDFYAARGDVQLVADLVSPEGVGVQALQLEALRLRLEEEGLFAAERKRPLPPFPRRIGVIASESGAVIHDIVTVLERRYPAVELVFLPSSVQGDAAALELAAALRALSRYNELHAPLDALILARGGGAEGDFAAFNDERVARAVFSCSVPVISALGHEVDTTLVDLVADLRAATPSAAAELVVPDRAQLRAQVRAYLTRARGAVESCLFNHGQRVASVRRQLALESPRNYVSTQQGQVNSLRQRLQRDTQLSIAQRRQQVEALRSRLLTLDPSSTLARGYAVCSDALGEVLVDASKTHLGAHIGVQLARGRLVGNVEYIEEPTSARDERVSAKL